MIPMQYALRRKMIGTAQAEQKVIVRLTGAFVITAGRYYGSVIINGVTYDTSQEIEVAKGTVITLKTYTEGYSSTYVSTITHNGTVVAKQTNREQTLTYDYAVNGDCTITGTVRSGGLVNAVRLTLTT